MEDEKEQEQEQSLPDYVASLIQRAERAEAERDAARDEVAERDVIIKRLLDGEERQAPAGDFQRMLRI